MLGCFIFNLPIAYLHETRGHKLSAFFKITRTDIAEIKINMKIYQQIVSNPRWKSLD